VVVWSKFGNDIRIGTVLEEKIENGWRMYNIDWHMDELYEQSIRWKEKMRNETFNKIWYRADEVNPVNIDYLASKIFMARHSTKPSWGKVEGVAAV